MIYIGIDPGKGGGIAALDDAGDVLDFFKMPADTFGLVDAVGHILALRSVNGPATAMLEQVWTSPQMGVVSAGTFMRGYGRLEGVLAAARIPVLLVVPVKWQNAMGCRTHGDKNISKARAAALFPALKITHANAAALLLAEYGRRLAASKR